MRKREIAQLREINDGWAEFMGEDKIHECPVCGSTASMDATTVRAVGEYTTQLLYIKCNDDHGKGCVSEVSVHADFNHLQNANEVLIAAWNVLAKNKECVPL